MQQHNHNITSHEFNCLFKSITTLHNHNEQLLLILRKLYKYAIVNYSSTFFIHFLISLWVPYCSFFDWLQITKLNIRAPHVDITFMPGFLSIFKWIASKLISKGDIQDSTSIKAQNSVDTSGTIFMKSTTNPRKALNYRRI